MYRNYKINGEAAGCARRFFENSSLISDDAVNCVGFIVEELHTSKRRNVVRIIYKSEAVCYFLKKEVMRARDRPFLQALFGRKQVYDERKDGASMELYGKFSGHFISKNESAVMKK